MSTRNTISRADHSRLDRAINALDAMSMPGSIAIVQHLQACRRSNEIELLIASRLSPDELEDCLGALCAAKIVLRQETAASTAYEIDAHRLLRIYAKAKKVNIKV